MRGPGIGKSRARACPDTNIYQHPRGGGVEPPKGPRGCQGRAGVRTGYAMGHETRIPRPPRARRPGYCGRHRSATMVLFGAELGFEPLEMLLVPLDLDVSNPIDHVL